MTVGDLSTTSASAQTSEPAATYRRVVATTRGGPDVLELVEEPVPEPALGEVRLRVLAAGVGFPDILMREGTYPGGPAWPFTPGCDVVGEVEVLGPGVTGVRRGDRVAALTYYGKVFGSYAEVVCLPSDYLIPVPDGVDPVAAVCLVLNYTTAFQMLKRTAGVVAGERLLVHGAAGGCGTAALELGRLYGLEVYGTASAGGADVVRDLGATPIDYKNEDFVERLRALGGVDVVLDGIGGTVSVRSYRVLRRGGRLVLFGHRSTLVEGRRSARKMAEFYASGAATLLASVLPDGRRVTLYQIAKLRDRHPEWFRADLGVLLTLLAQGRVAPIVAERLPLEEARRAHELLGRGGIAGKIVIVAAGATERAAATVTSARSTSPPARSTPTSTSAIQAAPGVCAGRGPTGGPAFGDLTDVIVEGTGTFAGASGTLTGSVIGAWQSRPRRARQTGTAGHGGLRCRRRSPQQVD